MALPKISLLKSSAMIGIVFVHLVLLYLLYHFHPSNQTVAYSSRRLAAEQITQITFITRSIKKISPALVTLAIPNNNPIENQNNTETTQVKFVERSPVSSTTNIEIEREVAPLILSLPEAKLDFSVQPRDILARPRNTVEYQSTRFNDRYKPSGNAIDSLKWKSKTFNFITGILGGNQKICTDADRKNQLPECVPDAYKPEY